MVDPAAQKHVVLSWSSGKDSAFTLWLLQRDPGVELVGLLTTVNEQHDRVAMHGVRRELLRLQAEACQLPLFEVDLPWPCSNDEYEARMATALEQLRARGVTHMAFGDLFLRDIRQYREDKLRGSGIQPLFPLWLRPTPALAQEMIDSGLVAHLTTVDPKQLAPRFVGRRFDRTLLDELPASVDPCGENGEFHTVVTRGPMFRRPIPVSFGNKVERDGFWFADVVPDVA